MSRTVGDFAASVARAGSHMMRAQGFAGDKSVMGGFMLAERDLRRGNIAGWLAMRDLDDLISAILLDDALRPGAT